jgi:zinc protease
MVKLKNGVRVIVRTDKRLPLTSICIAMLGGVRSEPADQAGITVLMSDLMTRGTHTRNSEEFAAEVEAMGASVSPFSGLNSLGLRIHGLSSDTPKLIDIATDALLHATFSQEEIDKQRAIQIATLKRMQERPMYHAQRQLAEAIFKGNPYARERLGTEATLKTITQQMLRTQRDRLLRADQLAICFAGNITQAEAVKLAKQYLAKLPKATEPLPTPTPAKPDLPARIVEYLPRQQAIVLAGYPGVKIDDPRADALSILEQSMSGLASTLGESVRGERALAYYVGAYAQPGIEPGIYVIYAGTQAQNTDEVTELFTQEAERVRTTGLPEREIERATRQLIAAHDMSLQDSMSVAMTSALNELYGLGFDFENSLPTRLHNVTRQQLAEAAALLAPDKRVLSIVLPENAPMTQP